jgi:hypothetical protein
VLAVGLAVGEGGVVDAFRTANLLTLACRAARNGVCGCCWSLLGRVHVENEAAAVEQGARMAGG